MSVDKHTERVLREFEENVLDIHHQSFPLWRLNRSIATYAALASFDSFAILPLFAPSFTGGIGHAQTIKGLEEGLAQAIQWLHSGTPKFDLTPTDDKDII